MNYKSFLSYIQRQTNKIFRSYKNFVKIYVDDIIMHSRILIKHLKNLRQMFELFRLKKVNLTSIKCFLNFSLIILLNQKVNFFDIIIVKKKIIAIIVIRFSLNL